jgi:hypothetical protein
MPPAVRDLRLAALVRFATAITIFNIVGHLWLGFEQSIAHPFVGVTTAYLAELVLETLEARATARRVRYAGGWGALVKFLLPAHITGVACAMLLYTGDRLWALAFAVTAAIGSKYVLRVPINGAWRHVFNPSNFGITATLLAFHWTGIAMPYMFAENLSTWGNWVLPAIMITSGTTLNALFTRRLPLVGAWLSAFVLQALVRSALTEARFAASVLPMSGVAFILFTFYMVTDPSTTPAGRREQVIFGSAVAIVYGVLMTLHVVFGLFFALSIVCVARGAWLALMHGLERSAEIQLPRAATAGGR